MNKTKVIIFSFLAAIVSFFLVIMADTSYNYYGAQKIYRVYLNGKSIGLIKNPEKLNEYINNEQTKLKEKFNVDNVYAPSGLEIKQELTYDEELKSAKDIYDDIKDIEPFTIKGYVVTVYQIEQKDEQAENTEEEKTLIKKVNVLDKQLFLNSLDETILAFIDEEQYEKYLKEEQPEIEEMSEGEKIENVYIKEDVYIKQDYISVDEQIFTDSGSLSQYLLYSSSDNLKTYTVKSGDTVKSIADKNELNTREFLIANKNISSVDTLLFSGQKVIVNLINPILTIVEERTEVEFKEKKYKTEIVEDSSYMVGYSQVIQSGKNGEELVTTRVLRENGKVQTALVIDSIETKPTINRVVKTGSRKEYVIGNAGVWAWPTRSGYYISTYFGWDSLNGTKRYHEALDITGTGCGSPIYAANDGVVDSVEYFPSSLGYNITIDHGNGFKTQYCHLVDRGNVQVGQVVQMGQLIGRMGDSGYSFGCHLHLVAYHYNNKFDPLQLYR